MREPQAALVPPVRRSPGLTELSRLARVGPALPHQDTPTRQPAPPLAPPPAQRSILGDRRGPARSLAASWRRGGRAGLAGAGKEGGCGSARGGGGEGGADPDVHSWAPGEVEAPGPAAGGRVTDAGTGTAAAAATMVKGPPLPRPYPGTPCGSSCPLPRRPAGPGRVGTRGGGGAGSGTLGRRHPWGPEGAAGGSGGP